MTFLVLMAIAYLLLGLLTISIGVLIAALEQAFTATQEQNKKARIAQQEQLPPVQDNTELLRQIRGNCEQIEADVYLQNQLHYWNSWNRNNEFRNLR
jgi:flagellar basal body-associated protein FliL